MPLSETVTDDTFSGIANWFQRCFLEHLSNPLSAANSRNIAFSDRIADQIEINLQIGNENTPVSFKDLMDFKPEELSKLFSINPENGQVIWKDETVTNPKLARFKEVMQNPANMPILFAAAAKASDNPMSVYSDIHSAYELASDLKTIQDEARMQMRARSDFTPAYAVDDETKSDTKTKSLTATIQDDVLITFHTGFMRDTEEGLVKELMQPISTLEDEATPEAATTSPAARPKSFRGFFPMYSASKAETTATHQKTSKFLAAVGSELVEKYVTAIANLFAVNPELAFELRDEGCFRIRFRALGLLKEKVVEMKDVIAGDTILGKYLDDLLQARTQIEANLIEYMKKADMQTTVPNTIGKIYFNAKSDIILKSQIEKLRDKSPLDPEPLGPPPPVAGGRRGSVAAARGRRAR